MVQLGFAKVLLNHKTRNIRDDGVMAHLREETYIIRFSPMMEKPGWRSMLS